MKKIIFAVLVFLSFFSASADGDISEKTFCVGISFPYMTHDYKIDDFDMVKINAVGLNLNARKMKSTMKIGAFLNCDIFMPYSKVIIWNDKYQTTTTISDYKYFMGIDALAGFYGILYQNNTINIPLGLGFHIDGFLSKRKSNNTIIKESTYTVGLGAWINFEVSVSKNIGVFAGSKVIYDFYYKSSTQNNGTVSNDGKCKAFTFIPALGLVWYF